MMHHSRPGRSRQRGESAATEDGASFHRVRSIFLKNYFLNKPSLDITN